MATAFVQMNENSDAVNATSSISVTLPNTGAGSLVVVGLKYEGATTTTTLSDGLGSTVTALTEKRAGNDDMAVRIFYILSSAGSGSTVTYTITLGSARAWKAIHVLNFSYAGTAAFDAEPSGGGGSGNVAPAASGNITTTGTDEVCVAMYGSYGPTSSSRQINGVAAGGSQEDAIRSASWYRLVTSTFTGQATAALDDNNYWILNLAAFKITAGGGGGGGKPDHYYRMMRAA